MPKRSVDNDAEPRVVRARRDSDLVSENAVKSHTESQSISSVGKEENENISIEIAPNAGPAELLRMSRTSQELREKLMSVPATRIWRIARESVGLPDCPDDLSEQKYAELLFGENICHLCKTSGEHVKLYFSLRLRLCDSCYEGNIFPKADIVKRKGEGFQKKLKNDDLAKIDHIASYYDWSENYVEKEFLEALNVFLSLSSDPREQQLFLEERRARTKKIIDHAMLVKKWQEGEDRRKCALGKEWQNQFTTRLKGLGYTDEDLNDLPGCAKDRARWIELFHKDEKYTEQVWREILPELEQIIERRKKFPQGCIKGSDCESCAEHRRDDDEGEDGGDEDEDEDEDEERRMQDDDSDDSDDMDRDDIIAAINSLPGMRGFGAPFSYSSF